MPPLSLLLEEIDENSYKIFVKSVKKVIKSVKSDMENKKMIYTKCVQIVNIYLSKLLFKEEDKKMKKRLCLMLASIMVVSMLATACGGNEAGNEGGNAGGERPEGVEITMGRKVVTNAMLPEGQDVENNALITKTEEVLKIDLVDEFNGVDSDYDQKVSMAMTSGEIPDIMRVSTFAEVIELYENEMIMPLDDIYEANANDRIKEKYDSFPAGLGLDRARIDGELYALPAANGDVAPIICFMRSDWIEEIGLTVDEDGDRVLTYQEIIDVAREFKNANVEGVDNPLGLCINEIIWREGEGAYGLNFIANAFNAWPNTWYVDESGALVYGSVQSQVKDFLKVANELYEEGILDAQVGTREFDAVTETMVNGQFGMCFGAGHCPSWGLVNVYAMDNDADYKCFLVSDLDGVIRHKHSDSAETGFIVVSSECEYPEVAVEILNLWFGYTEAEKVAFYNSDERVKELYDMGTDFAVGPYRISLNYYTQNLQNTEVQNAWLDGSKTLEECAEINASIVEWAEAYEAFKANEADPSVALDANHWKVYTSRFEAYSLMSVLDEYENQEWLTPEFPAITDSRWATLQDLEKQAYLKMIKGEVDIDTYWDEFVTEWNNLGGAEITADAAASLGL